MASNLEKQNTRTSREASALAASHIERQADMTINLKPQQTDERNAMGPTNQENKFPADVDEDHGIVVNARDMPEDIPVAKKKKKKSKKPASKRGLGKPTGFEEFHADAPLTIEQFAESKEAFNLDIPFVDRILKAIQRFERTRKLSPERRDVFYKYLAYGGVDISPNMFLGAQDTEEMDRDQMNETAAQANITEETKQKILDPKQDVATESTTTPREGSKLRSQDHLAKYVVDFEATMRGFLSRHAPTLYPFDTKDRVNLVTTTLERFMDYLLQHEVCPEYNTEVLNTRNLCRTAETELWDCVQAQRYLPGDFNIACSTLFGGSYGRNYDGETYWGPSETQGNVFVGLKPEQATQIVGFAIAGAASEDVYLNYLEITTGETAGKGFEIISTIQDHGFEITQIERPTSECRALYKENTSEFHPVGKVHAKFFRNPDAPPEDLTAEEKAALASSSTDKTDLYEDQYVFFIESKPLLDLLRPGMRVEATIHELNCGVWFFDEVIRVLPSFDTWIENELMIGWKGPKPVAGAPYFEWNVSGAAREKEDEMNLAEHHPDECVLSNDGDAVESVERNGHNDNENDIVDGLRTLSPSVNHSDDDDTPY